MKHWIAALFLTLMTATAASACGNFMMMILLFRAFPEAKVVAEAENSAVAAKSLGGSRWPGSEEISLHLWRSMQVDQLLARLEARMNVRDTQTVHGRRAHVLLINAYRWIELTGTPDGLQHKINTRSPDDAGALKIFTTHRVLEVLLDQELSWQDALAKGLITIRDPSGSGDQWLKVLKTALEQDRAALH